jgi:hypothetical protein
MESINRILSIVAVSCLMVLGLFSSLNAQTVFEAQLSGSNEATPITSMATGSVTATLEGNELVVEGSFEGLSSAIATDIAGGAHIHTGMAGANGGVLFPLSITADGDNLGGTFEASNNTFTLSSDQIDALMSRGMYVNIHSENYTGGELRGQLLPEADAYYRSNLSGAFEIPSVNTKGSGSVVFELKGDSLFVSGSFANLSSAYNSNVGSHLHIGSAGSNGGVSISLSPELAADNLSGIYFASDNAFELNAEQKTALMNRNFYTNIHTEAYGAGELRGQVVPAAATTFFAQLSGSAEIPSVATPALGATVLEVHGDSLFVSGSFAGLTTAFNATIGSHLHIGHAGQNGGVAITLNVDLGTELMSGSYSTANNGFELTTDHKTALFDRNMYVNVHSVGSPSGEIRGQVLGDAAAYFHTNLSGWHEVQPIMSDASGAASVEYMSNGNIMVSGGFEGLSSSAIEIAGTSGHLHAGSVDANGGVAFGLDITLGDNDTSGTIASSENMFSLSSEQQTTLFDEGMYVNVHSENFNGGELRGQVLFSTNFAPTAPELTGPADDATLSLEGSSSTAFEATWNTASDTNGNQLAYVWQASTDAEFNNLVVNANVGASGSFETTFGVLDTLLTGLGVDVGATATIYHRVIATDGSDETASEPRTANLERGMVTSNEEGISDSPGQFTLGQNYPNPFNPTTNITFSLAEAGQASLTVYNMLGQEVAVVANKRFNSGEHSVNFDASALASGIYIYRLQSGSQTLTKQMMLIK